MTTKRILILAISILVFASCASKNHTPVSLKYNSTTRDLKVIRTESARNFSKLKTKVQGDTLELYVYDKPFFLTFSKKKKRLFEFEVSISDSIRFIRYGINVYQLEDLKIERGKFIYPGKKVP